MFNMGLQGLLSKEDLHVNMCDALANLPTDLGIEAIETFSRRASSEPVRNKTGFMVRLPLQTNLLELAIAKGCCVVSVSLLLPSYCSLIADNIP